MKTCTTPILYFSVHFWQFLSYILQSLPYPRFPLRQSPVTVRMKLSAAAAIAPLLVSTSNGKPLQSENSKLLLARQGPGSYHAITGPTGGVQPRMEIRDLEATGDMWNIFVLALTEFEAADQHDIASYYQIAGMYAEHTVYSILMTVFRYSWNALVSSRYKQIPFIILDLHVRKDTLGWRRRIGR